MKWILFLVIVFVLSGCAQVEKSPVVKDVQEVVCDFPYIRHETSCCLDKNYNKICDEDEVVPSLEEKEEVVEEITVVYEKCEMPSGIECVDVGYYEGGVELTIKNKVGFNIAGLDVTLEGKGCSSKATTGSDLEKGSEAKFRFVCSPKPGEYIGKVRFIYTDPETGKYYNKKGEIVLDI